MIKNKPFAKLSLRQKLTKLRSKHDEALWKVEKLWGQMGEKEYSLRAKLTATATELAKVDNAIKALERTKSA